MGKYTLVLIMAAATAFGISALAEEGAGGKHKKGEGRNPDAIFAKMDANSDGKVSKDEFVAAQEARAKKSGHEMKKEDIEARFAKIDTDKDGLLTKEELKAGHAGRRGEHKEKAPEAAK